MLCVQQGLCGSTIVALLHAQTNRMLHIAVVTLIGMPHSC